MTFIKQRQPSLLSVSRIRLHALSVWERTELLGLGQKLGHLPAACLTLSTKVKPSSPSLSFRLHNGFVRRFQHRSTY